MRLNVDVEWEEKCWEQAWSKRTGLELDEEDSIASKAKEKRKRQEEGGSKRRKREEGAVVWGETVCEGDQERRAFLQAKTGVREGTKQTHIKLLSGVEWMSREILKECVWEAAECGDMLEQARDWDEWESDAPVPTVAKRSLQEEKNLFKILDELDKAASKSVVKKVPAKRGRKRAIPVGQPLIRGFAKREGGTVRVCVPTAAAAKRARLLRKDALEDGWKWRREACRLGGVVSGWLELALSLDQLLPFNS
jgi:hypothetical protein